MSTLRIIGGSPLSGTIRISGRKNAALKLIAAAVLTDGEVVIRRVPSIADVATLLEIIVAMGGEAERAGETVRIRAAGIRKPEIPSELGRRLRASLVLVGPLLARFGSAAFPHPGGCVIGKRSIAPHIAAFEQLGADVSFDGTNYAVRAPKLRGAEIYLKERSVTGTENILMAATLAEGTTVITNAAEERHVVNLADLLRAMGADISGDGTSAITVRGVAALRGAEVTTIPDEVETGTLAVAALVTGGELKLEGAGSEAELRPIFSKLDDFNAKYRYDAAAGDLYVLPSPDLRGASVQVNPWPGFPPDLQSPFTVLATQAKGTSLIHDWMYEGRLLFSDLLTRMGADITQCDPHRVLVSGPTKLQRSSLISPDLRAGAAFVVAALAAEGESVIEHAELIKRGYADLPGRLRAVGAHVEEEA